MFVVSILELRPYNATFQTKIGYPIFLNILMPIIIKPRIRVVRGMCGTFLVCTSIVHNRLVCTPPILIENCYLILDIFEKLML